MILEVGPHSSALFSDGEEKVGGAVVMNNKALIRSGYGLLNKSRCTFCPNFSEIEKIFTQSRFRLKSFHK